MQTKNITDHLRNQIIQGKYPCGRALPTRNVLLHEYGVSVATFQKTINALIREGFLESRGGSGVFVRHDLPSRCHLGLLLPVATPSEIVQDSLWNALYLEGQNFTFESEKVKLVPYYLGESPSVETDELTRLKDDIVHGRLCGAIRFRNWPELSLPADFPCVNVDYMLDVTPVHRIRMNTDHFGMFKMMMQKLHSCGVRRAAVIYHVMLNSVALLQMREYARDTGIEILPEWFLPFHIDNLDSIAYRWQLGGLFSENLKNHPDGLIVLNENLLPTVISSLNELAIIPGRDVHVVSHVNQYTGKTWMPLVQYAGFCASDILQSTMEAIRRWSPQANLAVTIPAKDFI